MVYKCYRYPFTKLCARYLGNVRERNYKTYLNLFTFSSLMARAGENRILMHDSITRDINEILGQQCLMYWIACIDPDEQGLKLI